MATKGALILPAGVALHIEEGALSIKHQGDIIIEGVPAQPLHTLTSEKGDVKLSCPDALNLTKVSAPAGTVSVTGKVSMQSIEAKAVDFSGGSLKISVINAGKSINLNGSKIEADVILAPKVDIAAGLKGRASAIECGNEIGPHKLRGGFNLGEFVSLMPTGAAILRAHGIEVPSSEEESADEDDEPEPAGVATEAQPEPDHDETVQAVEELSTEPETATVEAAAVGLEQGGIETSVGTASVATEEFLSPELEFPEPDLEEAVADTAEEVEEAALAMPEAEEIEEAALAMPEAEEIEEAALAMPEAEEIEEAALAMPEAEEIEEEIAAEPAEPPVDDEISQQLREILEYMGGAYEAGEVPQPVQRIFGYVEGNDLDGLRNNLSPLWQDLFKEIQTSGKYHANAVTRSFRAIRELLGPASD
jgi:hypothetical protein